MSPEELLIEAQLTIAKLQDWLAALNFREDVYLKNGAPYASQADVLATVAVADRKQYLTFNIAGTEYWMLPDLVTLVPKVGTLSLADGSVTLAKHANMATGSVFYRKTAGNGPPEVQSLATLKADLNIPAEVDLSNYVQKEAGKSLIPNELLANIHAPGSDNQDLSVLQPKETGKGLSTEDFTTAYKNKLDAVIPGYKLLLPAASSVAGRISGATIPSGWSISASGGTNLLITHNVAGKKGATVTVYEIDGADERLLSFDKGTAYTGVLVNGTTILIEGLAPTLLALRVEITLN